MSEYWNPASIDSGVTVLAITIDGVLHVKDAAGKTAHTVPRLPGEADGEFIRRVLKELGHDVKW
jgi:hypothetical protein